MTCTHLAALRTQDGVRRVSLAAEGVFCATSRPAPAGLRCVAPRCECRVSGGLHLCVECVYAACARERGQLDADADCPAASHLVQHDRDASHPISLSVDHGRLYCSRCDDFVYDPFLDAAVELQRLMAASRRRNWLSSTSATDRALGPGGIGSHALTRSRTKRRRVVSLDYWASTDAELALIDAHGAGRLRTPLSSSLPVGLYNLGNSCYMSSVLQALMNAPPLRSYFLADGHRLNCTRGKSSTDCFACAMDALICDAHCVEMSAGDGHQRASRTPSSSPGGHGLQPGSNGAKNGPFLVPHRMLDITWKHTKSLASYAQHDAHEFLIAALNLLHTHCRRKGGSGSSHGSSLGRGENGGGATSRSGGRAGLQRVRDGSKSGSHGSSRHPTSPVGGARVGGSKSDDGSGLWSSADSSIVHNLFSGTWQSDVICRVCGNRSPTMEKFYDLALDVDNDSKVVSSVRRGRNGSTVGGSGGVRSQHSNGSSRFPSSHTSPGGSHDGHAGWRASDESNGLKHGASGKDAAIAGAVLSGGGTNGHGRDRMESDANSLAECLSRFTEPEILGETSKMFCERCNVRQEVMKQVSLRSLPPILCFHFKRFEQSFAKIRRSEMVKIESPVEFPVDNLDLSPFQTSAVVRKRAANLSIPTDGSADAREANGKPGELDQSMNPATTVNPGDAIYDLFAVVNHSGKIDRGHYTTMIRRHGAWFNCDDEKVTVAASPGTVVRSEKAYLVFYAQRKPNIVF